MKRMLLNDFHQLNSDYLRGQLFFAALNLDIFSYLDELISPHEITEMTDYDATNVKWFLTALACEGMIEKVGDKFKNIDKGSEYLSKHSEFFIGDSFLNSYSMMSLEDAIERVKSGGQDSVKLEQQGYKVYDFKSLAKSSENQTKLTRVLPFIDTVQNLYENDSCFKFLDLGGGSGIMSIELAKAFPNARGVVFDMPEVTNIARESIETEKMLDRITVMGGDFIYDDIGRDYDLIIACGVFHFAKRNLEDFFKKLYFALKEDGFICAMTYTVSNDYLEPQQLFTRWLSSYLRGLELLLTTNQLEEAIGKYFRECTQFENINGYQLYQKLK